MNELKEKLAAIEHQRWADWQKWMQEQCVPNQDGSLTIPKTLVERWERQIATPFTKLSRLEKLSDMEQVDRYWPLISPLLSVTGETSDGFHSFTELYRFRALYNAAWLNAEQDVQQVKSWRHDDGELCFGGGWFIVMVQLPTGQISNHYQEEYWDLFKIPEVERAPKFDGHTTSDVLERLTRFIKEVNG